jgi:hypothetical protein
MTAASLAILVLLGQAPALDPSALVAQLGSRRYVEREAAADALVQLGRQALPALRSARSARDLEIRTRASALVNRIEGTLLTQPTLITLDVQDRPLPEVLKAVGEQAGVKLTPVPENDPSLTSRRITLREPSPLPFWKAIDRLCDAGHLQYNPMGIQVHPITHQPVIPLFSRNTQTPQSGMLTFDTGPFRVSLVNLHFQRDVLFGQGASIPANRIFPQAGVVPLQANPGATAGPAINEQFFAQVQLMGEPRLSLSQNGSLRVLEAIDERGQSLLPPANNGPFTQHVSGYFGLSSSSTLSLQVPLSHPTQPAKMIKRLRGTVSIAVSTRKPDPLVVPLSNTAGKSFQNDDVALSVQDIRVNPKTRQMSIDLSVRSYASSAGALAIQGAQGEFIYQRPDTHQQQIELVDAQGRALPWYNTSYDGEGTRLTLTLAPQQDQATPTEIRYYSLARTATDVNFVFEDVPMP